MSAPQDSVFAVLAPDGRTHTVYRPYGDEQGWPVCPDLTPAGMPVLPVTSTDFTDCPVCRDFLETCWKSGDVRFIEPVPQLWRGIAYGLLFTVILAVWGAWVLALFRLGG